MTTRYNLYFYQDILQRISPALIAIVALFALVMFIRYVSRKVGGESGVLSKLVIALLLFAAVYGGYRTAVLSLRAIHVIDVNFFADR